MRRPLLSLVAAGTLLAACGGGGSGSSPTSPAPVATAAPGTDAPGETLAPGTVAPGETSAPSTPAVAAPDALQFAAPAVGGGEIDFTQYAGRTVALWFWAPT